MKLEKQKLLDSMEKINSTFLISEIIWWAGPDSNRRSSPREGDVLTKLDYRPFVAFSS